jgi:hypothetical protein
VRVEVRAKRLCRCVDSQEIRENKYTCPTPYIVQTGLTDIEKSEILSRFDAALQNKGRDPERREEVEECIISEGKIMESKRLHRHSSLVSILSLLFRVLQSYLAVLGLNVISSVCSTPSVSAVLD